MATISRPRTAPTASTTSTIANGVPAPFPTELLQQERRAEGSRNPFITSEEHVEEPVVRQAVEEEEVGQDAGLTDILPSIATLQKSCIMTLNTLLSGSTEWKSIVPDRRHSMPSSPATSSTHQLEANALETLVTNLRTQQTTSEEMVEMHQATSEAELARELRERVHSLSPTLSPHDAALANSLATILTYFDRLSSLHASNPTPINASTSTNTPRNADAPPPIDMYDALTRQLNELQFERLTQGSSGASLEMAILWSQIDRELESIVSMCKERTERLPRFYQENLPPQYDYDQDTLYDFDSPPEYDGTGRPSLDKSKHREDNHHLERLSSAASSRISDEKMRLDLEGIAMAIDRLYLVAPQLHNQRVELKSSKLAQLEKARKEGSLSSRKGKEREKQELENIIGMLGKASERKLIDQSVVLEDGMQGLLEKAKMKDIAKREAFVEGLMQHSDAGRMHGQDAVLNPRVKDPSAKLTFPEFIRERVPPDSELLQDPSIKLSLPEFVAQNVPPEELAPKANGTTGGKHKKNKSSSGSSNRNRSLSAPPLAWLRKNSSSGSSASSSSKNATKSLEQAFDIVYVAENHENLHHVLVFFTTTTGQPTTTTDLIAEILPPFPEHISTGGDHLVVKSGSSSSLPLVLPARTTPGRKEVRVMQGHYEVKLSTVVPLGGPAEEGGDISSPLLDATRLESVNPSGFACASCSLPLIQIHGSSTSASPSPPGTQSPASSPSPPPQRGMSYRDLPSEHWEELVEAWMCHSDQKLHDQVIQHGKAGFWPSPRQAYVGGSYLLFEESVVSKQNLLSAQVEDKNHEDWRVCRCLCGAIVGRCTTRTSNSPFEVESSTTTCYRVLKYAIRPVTPNPSDSIRIPLSAFIVEDMMEYVHAHASYRFVIRDEEDEKPRILIWLFKPKMRLAYTTPRSRAIPKSGSIMAAKVLYKLVGPSEAATDLKALLNKYPGFPQAEYLSYPMTICQRVAALLKESNTAYPEALRTMTGLEVGWLHRR